MSTLGQSHAATALEILLNADPTHERIFCEYSLPLHGAWPGNSKGKGRIYTQAVNDAITTQNLDGDNEWILHQIVVDHKRGICKPGETR
jgi:hypothetical protein